MNKRNCYSGHLLTIILSVFFVASVPLLPPDYTLETDAAVAKVFIERF